MTDSGRREAARQFANKWKDGGDELKDGHKFWLELLHDVLGIEKVTDYIDFEKTVKLPERDGKIHSRRIDGYIPAVRVLIEQKGSAHSLDEKEMQSGGELLTPYEQGKRYNDNLPFDEKARWIVTCNFKELWIYDMNATVPKPVKVEVIDLQTKYPLLEFLVKKEVKALSHEMEVSIKAGDIVGLIYDAFLQQYGIEETASKNETAEEKARREWKLRSLNALCVRLVFCLYAEDAPHLFGHHQFHDYMERFDVRDCRRALIELFKTLDTPIDQREEYLEEDLKAFPYVNGGLFADETVEIPQFTQEIKDLLLKKASEDFDWKDISPTIFGAVFESTLNPETRRASGMHYTSQSNIHKVIDPLFLDDLKAEFEAIKKISQPRSRRAKLDAFQDKLASLTFLDPAAGSGNFLTESYIAIRRLENQVLAEKEQDQISFATEESNPIRVSIQQFYGIEINDFAVTVAKTALWIAESQMLEETKEILYGFRQEFFPLKTYANITEGNALRLDWDDVVPRERLTYLFGNPAFVGYTFQSPSQKADLESLGEDIGHNIDYVAGWYYKAAKYIQGTNIRCAFVSTNSITQGEQVYAIWKPLMERYSVHIDFAYRGFEWDSEANEKAQLHVVIIGFSEAKATKPFRLFDQGEVITVPSISPYLVAGQTVFVSKRHRPLSAVPEIRKGSQPTDGGNLILSGNEEEALVQSYPQIRRYVKRYVGADEFINARIRYCFWLKNASPNEIRSCPELVERVARVRDFRLSSKKEATRKWAQFPTLFTEDRQPLTDYILVPSVSSEKRRYVPMGFVGPDVIANNLVFVISGATLDLFGILESNVHMAWMRAVCGRLETRYRYSGNLVYNTFPWPEPTQGQKALIEKTAQGILDARALYPDSSLADLYDPLTMPPELRKAHTANDRAVMAAFGFDTRMSEADCVAELMEMYQELTK